MRYTFLTYHSSAGRRNVSRVRQIELRFKALKRNLKIKTLVDTSDKTLNIRVWIALIALLLAWYRARYDGINSSSIRTSLAILR